MAVDWSLQVRAWFGCLSDPTMFAHNETSVRCIADVPLLRGMLTGATDGAIKARGDAVNPSEVLEEESGDGGRVDVVHAVHDRAA
jgi:hypothetical protein